MPGNTSIAMVEPVGGHGGMNYYDFPLCQALKRIGVNTLLFTCDETNVDSRFDVEVFRVYQGIYSGPNTLVKGLRFLRGSLRAALKARSVGCRIAHFHFFQTSLRELIGVFLFKVLCFKILATVHDVESFDEGKRSQNIRSIHKMVDRVIVHNKTSKFKFQESTRYGHQRVAVIPHGHYLDFTQDIPEKMRAKKHLGVSEFEHVLLFFGQIKKVKGLDILLKSLPGVLKECPRTVLIIAGKLWKDEWDYYQRIITDKQIETNVLTHIRYIPDEEVKYYYAAADIVVLPYRKIFQSGVLLMAMSYGKAVVASDIDGMKEVVTDGLNGLIFKKDAPDDLSRKILSLLSNKSLTGKLGEAAWQKMATNYSWENIAHHTKAIYEELLDNTKCTN